MLLHIIYVNEYANVTLEGTRENREKCQKVKSRLNYIKFNPRRQQWHQHQQIPSRQQIKTCATLLWFLSPIHTQNSSISNENHDETRGTFAKSLGNFSRNLSHQIVLSCVSVSMKKKPNPLALASSHCNNFFLAWEAKGFSSLITADYVPIQFLHITWHTHTV